MSTGQPQLTAIHFTVTTTWWLDYY